MSYVELRCKSNFSFLTGASHPEELVEHAISQGLAGLALTDLNGVYGMPRGYKVVKNTRAEKSMTREFRYLCGAELELTGHPCITVLAKTRAAYGRLCNLITDAKRGREKGRVVLSLADFVAGLAPVANDVVILPRLEGDVEWGALKEAFGRNLYQPLTFYQDGKDHGRVAKMREIEAAHGVLPVATNDVEYHVKERKPIQDVLICIREGKTLEDVGFKLRGNAERYVKTPEQMARLYKEFPGALARTVEIARECAFCPSELRYRYPSEWIPEGFTAQSYLEHLVRENAPKIYKNDIGDAAAKLLAHEMKLIDELGFADYFLTIYDIVRYARSIDILCQGRGSAANSAVCYVLGITAIDPVSMDLLFERFISAERGEPPDIDIDFEHERREEVLQYIYNRYGRARAAMVSAVITYGRRSSLREVSKAFGLAVGTLSAREVERRFDELIQRHPQKEIVREQIEIVCRAMKGFPRHLSIHSGGFTLSADPIVDIVPVEPARMENRTIIQWDKYDLDTLGLIKVDVLSLGMLTCLSKCLKLLGLQLHEIPPDDKPTYEMIQRCETVGVFQIESRAQMSMLGRLKPANFYDLVVEVAIVRPGPIIGKMVHPYLRRRQGLETYEYPNDTVKEILGRTMGVPLFQEQIMKLAISLAGFTPGESDVLRKSINAWRSSEDIGVVGKKLQDGLLNAGLSRKFADEIFEHIQGFSNYGFPESHAASFALLAYASSYLKRHHPAEFATALVNSQPLGFYRNDTILYEAMRNGVEVRPVSVLKSKWDCEIEDGRAIRLGFRVVHGLARAHVDELVAERERRAFDSLADFLKRSNLRKDVLAKLALAGRFEDFKWDAKNALWSLLEYENLLGEKAGGGQLDFFRDTEMLEVAEAGRRPDWRFPRQQAFEEVQADYEAFAVSLHGHPMAELRKNRRHIPKMTSKSIREMKHGAFIKAGGLILVRQMPPTANGTCFCTLEDEFGFLDVVFFPDVFDRYKDVFLQHCFIIVEGQMQKDGNTVSVIAKRAAPIWPTESMHETPLAIKPDQYFY